MKGGGKAHKQQTDLMVRLPPIKTFAMPQTRQVLARHTKVQSGCVSLCYNDIRKIANPQKKIHLGPCGAID